MKKISLIAVVILSLMFAVACSMVKYKKGDNTKGYLNGVKKIAVQFDYSKARVGKFATEAEYVNEKVTELNKKEAGKGDTWKGKWDTQKDAVFTPKFETLINEYAKEKGLEIGTKVTDAELTMVLTITKLEPGWNIGISRQDAFVSFQIDIYKTADMNNPVATYEMNNVPGGTFGGFDFDASTRLGESFAKAGKELGAFFAAK